VFKISKTFSQTFKSSRTLLLIKKRNMSTTEWPASKVRNTFIDYFVNKRAHTHIPSSSVIPHDDPTILFANAGMNQFKPIFLGKADPNSEFGKLKRAANSQKCIRAGGKHNDLDDVGKDTYHHTFFEMLGNWSFGDYFKKEAIDWAWELLTKVYGLDPNRLYATYFEGDSKQGLEADLEAKQLWLTHLPENHVLPGNAKDNFWEMGDTGPCGPCSELHYDRIGGRNAAALVNKDDPNVIEIWNLVFIQYNREENRSLRLLPDKHVDTGMGFERITSILQNKLSNYDTDVFTPIFKAIQQETGCRDYTYKLGKEDVDTVDTAYRVIADHIRTLSIAIADGGVPSAVTRGYVLRRIVRRAVNFGDYMQAKLGFLSRLVDAVVESLGDVFPSLKKDPENIKSIIYSEEVKFSKTKNTGKKYFDQKVKEAQSKGLSIISGDDAFELYATYGYPVDLTQIMAELKGLSVDKLGFEEKVKEHALISGQGSTKKNLAKEGVIVLEGAQTAVLQKELKVPTTDDSYRYQWVNLTGAKILALYSASEGFVTKTRPSLVTTYAVILDKTNFYAEGGGQIYDTGFLNEEFKVTNVQSSAGYVVHSGRFVDSEASFSVGDTVLCAPDFDRRQPIAANHTSTHMLNYALRKVLGEKCDQRGSFVEEDRFRFDYSYGSQPTVEQLKQVEDIVNDLITRDLDVHSQVEQKSIAEKINGLRAMFGEQYPENVRVVTIGQSLDNIRKNPESPDWINYSIEFCGGTHLHKTSQAQKFIIVTEGSISSGIRRIEAFTKQKALDAEQEADRYDARVQYVANIKDDKEFAQEYSTLSADIPRLKDIALLRKKKLVSDVEKLYERKKNIDKENEKMLLEEATRLGQTLVKKAADAGEKVIAELVQKEINRNYVNAVVKVVETSQNPVPVVLIGIAEGKDGKVASYYFAVPKDKSKTLSAKDWLGAVASVLNGTGGGSPTFAQGSGKNVDKVEEALRVAKEFALSKL
jgi:alanyl-tRNA synthetase